MSYPKLKNNTETGFVRLGKCGPKAAGFPEILRRIKLHAGINYFIKKYVLPLKITVKLF
jgi:hypothetical protein